MGRKDKCENDVRGRVIAGIILTGVGLVFLLSNFRIIPPIEDSWPLFLVIVGGALLFGALRDRKKREDAVPPDDTSQEPLPPS